MTIGQRIAYKRKELALSQEALGEQLGVSRQAIYKWEADAALPEIDKLIALAKLYGVSVGWLLGVEEAPEPQAEAAPDGQLSEAQLSMVERLVNGYLSALPAPLAKLPALFKAAATVSAAGVVVLFFVLLGLIAKVNDMYQLYSEMRTAVYNTTPDRIDDLEHRIDSILQTQGDITSSYAVDITAVDYGQNTLSLSLRAVPKTLTPGLQALFLVNSDGAVLEIPGEPRTDGGFSAAVTVPLADLLEVSVCFADSDGIRRTQLLESRQDLHRDSLPYRFVEVQHTHFHLDKETRTITLQDPYVYAEKAFRPAQQLLPGVEPPVAVSMRVGLFLNKQLIGWAEPCAKPADYSGVGHDDHEYYRLPDCTLTLEPTDRLCVAALTEDSIGRSYLSAYREFHLEDDPHGNGLRLVPDVDVPWDWDVANWTF